VLEYRTLCLDFDAGLRNLDLALGMTDFTVMDYGDVLNNRIELEAAYSESPLIQNLFFLSAPAEKDHDESDIEAFKEMFETIRSEFDFCLIDSPPGIGAGFKLAHCNTNMSIIVTKGELPSIRDAVRTASIIRASGVNNLRLLVNRVKPSTFRLMKTTIDDIVDITGVQLLGIVREDKCIPRALHEGTPLVRYKKLKSAYNFLGAARRIAGEDIPLRY